MGLSEFADNHAEMQALRDANNRLRSQLRHAKSKTDEMVSAAHQGALDAMVALGGVPAVPAPPKDARTKGAEAALWVLTDWQGAKRTSTYNSEVMQRRVMQFVDKAIKITEIQRADHPVKHCTIAFGGDLIEGVQIFPQQPFEIDQTIFGQFVTVSRLINDVVRRALAAYETVSVVAEWGNHGRMGSTRSVIPNSDNLDRMTYELSRQLLVGERRLTWPENGAEDIQRIEIGNYRALLIHGDEIGRGGNSSPMTIVRHADRWRSGAYPWEFRDLYTNHYHTHAEWAMANGQGAVYQTGSTESDNRYARDTMAASAIPSQRLHFIDPVRGMVTAVYKIILD
jgi:hypothetical protein